MTSFIIAPYPPIDDPSKWDELSSLSDLKIVPNKYQEEMKKSWPMVEFFSTSNKIPLEWMINIPNADATGVEGTIGMLHSDLQVVSFDTPHEPFFLCLWHFAVHAPFDGKENWIGRFSKKTDPRGKQDCPTMGAMLKSMDESLGCVLSKLEEHGIADNTIVIFCSDNGGNMYDRVEGTTPTNNAPLRSGKGAIYEGGVRIPWIVKLPGVVEPATKCDSVEDIAPTLDLLLKDPDRAEILVKDDMAWMSR